MLESRIAPAAILTFTDIDGDVVKVSSDQALTATVSFTATGNPAEILVSGVGHDGASLAFAVTKSATGDGLVNIGRIMAPGLDLGAVTVPGDLGKIVCGNVNNPRPGLKSLTARSIGNYNVATQGGFDLYSVVTGDLGALNVAGSVLGISLQVTGKAGAISIGGDLGGDGNFSSARLLAGGIGSVKIGGDVFAGKGDESGKIVSFGDLGSVKIGGSLYGALDAKADNQGQIFASGNAGPISVGHDIIGAVSEQKAIEIGGNAGAITVGGSLVGGAGKFSGGIYIGGNSGAIKIAGDVCGGVGDRSGQIIVGGTAAGFIVGHDIRGGSGSQLPIITEFWQIKFGAVSAPVKVGGDILGGTGFASAIVDLGTGAPSFTLGGSLIGGGAALGQLSFPAGEVIAGHTPLVTIGGDLMGSAFGGGRLEATSIAKLAIKGSIIGTTGVSGLTNILPQVSIAGDLGIATIAGEVQESSEGGTLTHGQFFVGGNVQSLQIHGSVTGGTTQATAIDIRGNAGAIRIGGSLHVGPGTYSGGVIVKGRLGFFQIGGSEESIVRASSFGSVNVVGDVTGYFFATKGSFDFINIGGSLRSDVTGGSLDAVHSLGVVKIGGSILGSLGVGDSNLRAEFAPSITVGGDIVGRAGVIPIFQFSEGVGAIRVGGDLRGPQSAETRILFNTSTSVPTRGFASLSVHGNVENVFIGSGVHNVSYTGLVPDTTLGPVTVGGDWISSSIVAGIGPGVDLLTATADDEALPMNNFSRIAAITIAGQVLGSAAVNDHFGFVAHSIGPVKIAGKTYQPGATPIELSPITGDVTIRVI